MKEVYGAVMVRRILDIEWTFSNTAEAATVFVFVIAAVAAWMS